MAIHKIPSTKTIETLEPNVRRLNDGIGLHIRQSPTGRKTWYQDYSHRGRRNSIALGHFPELGLDEARDKSVDIRRQLVQGIDPAAARRESKLTRVSMNHPRSVKTIAQKWFAKKATGWSPDYAGKTASRLNAHVYPSFGDRVIHAVETKDVTQLVESLCDAGTVDTAGRVLSICRRFFDYAIAKGFVSINPCHGVKEVIPDSVVVNHAAVTTPAELRDLLKRLADANATFVVKCALDLTVHTFLRSIELRGAKWQEIDLEGGLWTVPASRMKGEAERKKNEGPHFVPLSRQAVEILRQLKRVTGHQQYVFAGQGRKNPMISGNTINAALRRSGISTNEEQTAHGFRATARTMLVEQLKFDVSWVELQLDHVVKDANGNAYNRAQMLPDRVVMMQRWSDYLDWLQVQPANAVGPIHGVAAPAHLCSPTDPDSIIRRFLAEHVLPQWAQAESLRRTQVPSVASLP